MKTFFIALSLSTLVHWSYQFPLAPGQPPQCDPIKKQTFPASALISELINATTGSHRYAHRLATFDERPTSAVCDALQGMKTGDFKQLLDPKSFFKYPKFGKCELTLTEDVGLLFKKFSILSDSVIQAFNAIGGLSRFDLFHGHLFLNEHAAGMIFHSMEYPKMDEQTFPYPLGWCQTDSTILFDETRMSRRNHLLLFPFKRNINFCPVNDSRYKVSLWEIHGESIGALFPDVTSPMYTMYTELFGLGLSDVVYLGPSSKLSWSSLPKLPCN